MAEGSSLERLRLRKQTLLLESTVNRLEIRRELEVLRTGFAWLEDPVGAAREKSPVLLMLAPVAGVLASRLLRGSRPGTSKLAVVLDCIRLGWPLWKQFSAGFSLSPDRDEKD